MGWKYENHEHRIARGAVKAAGVVWLLLRTRWIATPARLAFHVFASWNCLWWLGALALRWFGKANGMGAAHLIGRDTELVIEATPGAASGAFEAYFCHHNPSVKIASRTHCLYPIRYAARRGIPVLVLWRGSIGSLMSEQTRWPQQFSRAVSSLRWALVTAPRTAGTEGVFSVYWLHMLRDPAQVVRQINAVFGTQFNEGDGHIARIRTGPETTFAGEMRRAYGEATR